MKKTRNILFLALLGISQLVQGQSCDPAAPIGGSEGRSVIGVITGTNPHLGEAGIKQAQKGWMVQEPTLEQSFALAILKRAAGTETGDREVSILDSSSSAQAFFYQGMVQTVDGKYTAAVSSFNQSELTSGLDPNCREPYFKVIAQYLEKYGEQPPLFKGFNGGFYNFTCDSLQWKFLKPDSANFHAMLNSLLDLSTLTAHNEVRNKVYLELMGDLLIHHPDRITANWYGGLSYYRLAFAFPESKDIYEEKAIFALEAPKTSRRTFDKYRFNQLRKRLAEDLDSAATFRADFAKREAAATAAGKDAYAFLASETATMGAPKGQITWQKQREIGSLSGIIEEANRREIERLASDQKFAGEVDLKGVKGEATFNIYGIAVIIAVVGAVVFFWIKLTRARPRD